MQQTNGAGSVSGAGVRENMNKRMNICLNQKRGIWGHFMTPWCFFLFFMAVWLAVPIKADASSATVFFSSDKASYGKGEEINVTITVNSSAVLGNFEAGLFFDDTCMSFEKGGKYVEEQGGLIQVYDHKSKPRETKKYRIRFLAREEGNCELMLADSALVFGADGSEMSVSANRLSIEVSGEARKEENTLLSSLDPSDGTLVPAFSSETTSYTLEVPYQTTSVLFNAVPEDSSCAVEITGNMELSTGKNQVYVKVTGIEGGSRSYGVLVSRLSEDSEEGKKGTVSEKNAKKKKKQEEKEEAEDVSFSIKEDEEGNCILTPGGSYKVEECKEEEEIPVGYMKTQVILEGYSVTAYTLEKDLENDFLLMYAENPDGEKNFYYYDRKEKTLQRYTGSTSMHGSKTTVVQDQATYDKKLSTIRIIIGIMAGIIVLLLIAVLSMTLRLRNGNEEL